MWRALFIAMGIMLISLGVECTVVGRFTISQEARLPRFIQEIWELERGQETDSEARELPSAPSVAGYGGMPNTVSRFGPSRFGANSYGNDQFSQFNLTGYPAAATSAPPARKKKTTLREVKTQDWMPWSLIAAGTIIVLYSKSITVRDSH